MLDTVISDFIEQQFPQIYKEEGPFFVEFLKQYYVWMETDPTSPVYQARHHLSNQDIDTAVDDYLLYYKEKYLKGIQLETDTNTRELIKNSIDLYRSKGTENAIQLFFDLIFQSEAEVYYPGTDIWRLSNAQWVLPRYLEITSMPANRLLVGRAIVGVNSGATAFVESLVRRKIKNNYVEVLYISSLNGEFQTGEIIRLSTIDNTAFSDFPTVIGSLTTLEVTEGGNAFAKGQIVKLESRTGDQGRALITDLESITGIVDFSLDDGGWGYTVNTDINVSEKVLNLTTAHIVTSTNTSLEGQMVEVYQPMSNVQWYNNTAFFETGDTVYNYYANGTLIGVNVILSSEYGTNATTNFFLLNTTSGNNYMDPTQPFYYASGNTAYFQVQNAGWNDQSANGTFVQHSTNATIYCSGNSQLFDVDDIAYQLSTNNVIYVTADVKSVTPTTSNSFYIEVTGMEGLYLSNQPLLSQTSGGNVSITSISYDIGLMNISGNFSTVDGNIVRDTSNNSLWSASVSHVSFGDGANTGFDTDLLFPETVSINTNYLRDHIDVTNQANWINAASYGASLNDANLTNQTLALALEFDTKTLGMIARLQNQNPGVGYSYAPFVDVVDPLVAPLALSDFVIRYDTSTGIFVEGEEITQDLNGAIGLVKFANTSEVHIRRLSFEDRWTAGNSSNAYLMIGTTSGHQAYPTEVTYDIGGVAGHNAVVSTNVTSSSSAVARLKVTDSGFCFRDGDDVTFSDLNDVNSGLAVASVVTTGVGGGFYKTTSGFLSADKYLQDGDYYQDFSYEIRSPITVSRYADMLKNVLHVSGTKAFSAILKSNFIDSESSTLSSAVVVDYDAPQIITSPIISGAGYDTYVLSATVGTWYGIQPTSYTYQWKNNEVAIPGATNPTYTIQNSDIGDTISCDITAINPYGNTTVPSQNSIGPIGDRRTLYAMYAAMTW